MELRGIGRAALLIAAVAGTVGAAFAAEPSFGTFTDARDGKTYKTTIIGGKKWMAQNLNYETPSGSWCYGNNNFWRYYDDNPNCDEYGRLYDWETAITACPAGYHLPSAEEWDNLVKTAGGTRIAGKKLKAKNGWDYEKTKNGWNYRGDGNGTDDYGFSALPGGSRRHIDGNFLNVGNNGHWWTSTELHSDYVSIRHMRYNRDYAGEFNFNKSWGISVRCVADAK